MSRASIVEREKTRQWLIGAGRAQGKWKETTAGRSTKHSRKKENSQ